MYFSFFRNYYNVILTFFIKLSLKIVNLDLDVHGNLDWHSLVIYYYLHRMSMQKWLFGLVCCSVNSFNRMFVIYIEIWNDWKDKQISFHGIWNWDWHWAADAPGTFQEVKVFKGMYHFEIWLFEMRYKEIFRGGKKLSALNTVLRITQFKS
jgi:hypothetical protein